MGVITVNTDFEKLYGFPERELYAKQYLTFEALEDCTFIINWTAEFRTDASDGLMKHISYSLDNGETWTTQEINDEESLYVEGIKAGQTILLKGDGLTANGGNDEYISFTFMNNGVNAKVNVYGNIMSLIYGDDFEGKEFDDNYEDTLGWLFEHSYVVSAKNLILPDNVFAYCYQEMFNNCTELTEAPELPATTLTNGCYSQMFKCCTSLVNAPVLPATTLVSSCYAYMFNGCTNLNHIKALFTTTPSDTYTKDWLKNVAATGTFVKNTEATWNVTGANGVPSEWTVETA